MTADSFLLLLKGVNRFDNSHLSRSKYVVLGGCGSSVFFGLRVLDTKTHELTALKVKGLIRHGKGSLDCLRGIEFDVGYTLASPTAGISDDADIPNLSTISLTEKVPNVSFLGL